MLARFELTRTRATIAALVATAIIGGFAIAWANASSPSSPSPSAQLASSNEDPGDISGPCDELENADKPECAGTTSRRATPTGDTTSTTGATTPTPTAGAVPVTAAPGGDVRSFAAAEAGTVTYAVNGATLTLVDAAPAAGWRVEVERASGIELDLDFRSGTRRVQVDVEFEDGGVRERVRIRDDADDTRTEITNGTVTRVDDDRDDSLDPGDDDSEDDSGHGSDDDAGDDDDSSGHGSDDDDDSDSDSDDSDSDDSDDDGSDDDGSDDDGSDDDDDSGDDDS